MKETAMPHARLTRDGRAERRGSPGFTIVELLTSIFVIGLILSILIVGLRFFFAAGQATKQRAAVTQMKQAVSEFQTKFGILPPLVRDQYVPASGARSTNTVSGQNVIAVWSATDLQGIPAVVVNNEYWDPRFSVRTLPYYLMGALDLPLLASGPATYVVDGVAGPGSYRPNDDGTFRIPAEILQAAAASDPNPRKLTAEVYTPSIDPGSADPKLVSGADPVYDPALDTSDLVKLQLKDSKGVVYRFYRWEKLPPTTAGVLNQNIPRLVGDANDPAVRGAKYALVGAGPNGVFGDENITTIRSALGRPLTYPEVTARKEAAADNIVEVGQ